MKYESTVPDLRKNLEDLGMDENSISFIIYNAKRGMSVQQSIEELAKLGNDFSTHRRISLYIQNDDGSYRNLGKVDVQCLVSTKCILRSNSRYVWFLLFGNIYRYRKQSDDASHCYL